MITAIEFGKKYDSCTTAMIWRRSLPPGTTQAEAYLLCQRGDWLVWQLARNCVDHGEIQPLLQRAVTKIVARAIRRAVKSIRGNQASWAKKYRTWARRWLMGEDRSRAPNTAVTYARIAANAGANAATHAAYSAANAAVTDAYSASIGAFNAAADAAANGTSYTYADIEVARTREQKLQSRDIRFEIPVWQGWQ